MEIGFKYGTSPFFYIGDCRYYRMSNFYYWKAGYKYFHKDSLFALIAESSELDYKLFAVDRKYKIGAMASLSFFSDTGWSRLMRDEYLIELKRSMQLPEGYSFETHKFLFIDTFKLRHCFTEMEGFDVFIEVLLKSNGDS